MKKDRVFLVACLCIGAMGIISIIYLHLRKKRSLYVPEVDQHPVLEYQRNQSYKTGSFIPATPGDIFAPPDVAGPVDGAYSGGNYGAPLGGGKYGSFGYGGVAVNDPRGMGVPVPSGALKYYNERYNKDQFKFPNPHFSPPSPPGVYSPPQYIGPILPPSPSLMMSPSGFPSSAYPSGFSPSFGVPYQNRPSTSTIGPTAGSSDFYRPYGPNAPIDQAPFFGSVDAYSPFPEITGPWEKAGVLTSKSAGIPAERSGGNILNLYRRPIAPLQDLWEYQVQDKNGFVIKLDTPRGGYLQDGDIIHNIVGKEGLGPWEAHIFVQNKYVWV